MTVRAYPYRGSSVSVAITRVSGAGNPGNVVQSLPSLPKPETRILPLKNRRVVITIEKFADGDAYSIVIRSPQTTTRRAILGKLVSTAGGRIRDAA